MFPQQVGAMRCLCERELRVVPPPPPPLPTVSCVRRRLVVGSRKFCDLSSTARGNARPSRARVGGCFPLPLLSQGPMRACDGVLGLVLAERADERDSVKRRVFIGQHRRPNMRGGSRMRIIITPHVFFASSGRRYRDIHHLAWGKPGSMSE